MSLPALLSSPSLSPDKPAAAGPSTARLPLDRWVVTGAVIALLTTLAGIGATGINVGYFLQPAAAWIVLGGTLGVTLVTTPRHALQHAARRIAAVLRQPPAQRDDLLDEILFYVRLARLRGLLAIEPSIPAASHPFLRETLSLVVDVKNRLELQAALDTKLRLRERQGDADAKVLEVAAGFAPAIGVIGTVIGLIKVLRHFSDFDSVALGIGTAFVSTMYGLALANFILLPAAHRIRSSVAEAFETEEMIVEGALALLDGTHPALVRERLASFLRQEEAA